MTRCNYLVSIDSIFFSSFLLIFHLPELKRLLVSRRYYVFQFYVILE